MVPGAVPVANIQRRAPTRRLQELELEAIARLNKQHVASRPDDAALAARMKSFETAFGMPSRNARSIRLVKRG